MAKDTPHNFSCYDLVDDNDHNDYDDDDMIDDAADREPDPGDPAGGPHQAPGDRAADR